jgi:NAD(P)-dependent dehydrogenase (short-subunit alcohol dehydrogenase family)
MSELQGKKMLFVGGSSGIGLAAAKASHESGAVVTIASRSARKLEAAAATIGNPIDTGIVDVTDDASVSEFLNRRGSFDHVVVTAADVVVNPIGEISVHDAQAAMDSKFWGIFRIAKAAKIEPGGSLNFVAGFRSQRPAPGLALMSAINAAIEGLTRGLALDLRPVRVNAVSPAMVDTPLWASLDPKNYEALLKRVSSTYPAGTVGRPEDVAKALLFLASNPYATGTVLTLDGGASLV